MLLVIDLSGCCTKKDCEYEEDPKIKLKFLIDTINGFSEMDLDTVKLCLLNKTNELIEDSVEINNISSYNPIFSISNNSLKVFFKRVIELKDFNYVIKISTIEYLDTIKNINYDRNSYNVDCNTCFPFGNGSATQLRIENFEFKNKGVIYHKNDILIIMK